MRIAMFVAGAAAWYAFAAWVIKRWFANGRTPGADDIGNVVAWLFSPALFPLLSVGAGAYFLITAFANWLNTPIEPRPKPERKPTMAEDWDR